MPRYTTYSTGTVTATNGSRIVTGVNTAWMVASTQEFQVVGGDLLRIVNQRPVVIDTVDSPTQVTLVEPWPHSTASASAYTVIRYATPPEARVLGALETLAQRGSSASPFERVTFDSGGVRFQMRDDGSGLVGLYIGATGTADGSLTLAETINRTTLARILRGPLSWTGTTYMGLLIQSLTTTQRDALSSPGNGGGIYNSTVDRHQFRAGGAWHEHARRGGDIFTGAVTLPANGLVVGTNQLVASGGNVYIGANSGIRRLEVVDAGASTSVPFKSVGQSNSIRFVHNGSEGLIDSHDTGEATLQVIKIRGLTVTLSAGGADRVTVNGSGHILPAADNTQNLGSGSLRMATIFAGTGTINTSDAREKDNIAPITDALLDKWAGVEAISFKFRGRNRTHFGYTAQQVLECMGEDAWTYALLCKDAITKPVKRTVKKLVQKTEAKTVSEETIEVKDGVPTIVVKAREVQEPVVEIVQVIGADGKPVIDADGKPRLHPVPVMAESEVEETVDEPAGGRLGLRYDQCAVVEAAWARRELFRALARIAALEAA